MLKGLLAAEKVSEKMEENSRKRKRVMNGFVLKSIVFWEKIELEEGKSCNDLKEKKSRKRWKWEARFGFGPVAVGRYYSTNLF